MPDRVGQQMGNYRLLRLLGRGGFAEVYLGEHVYLKRRAALKVLHTSIDDLDVGQFLAEAQTLARLSHPHIVHVFDFAVEQGTPFLAMDYAPRGTLRKLHPRGSCLSLDTTAAYVKQIAAALHYAHEQRVIHRDVKPENMLLGPDQQLLLSDFGISILAATSEQLSTRENAGTLAYMAPEQIQGKPVFASDQYALGVVAYEWLCGVRPFEGTGWLVAFQQVSVPPPALRERDSSLPQQVEDVVLKALAKDPLDRYASVQMFAQALEAACQASRPERDSRAGIIPGIDLPAGTRLAAPTSTSPRVFLSASPFDGLFTARLKADVERRGVEVWQKVNVEGSGLPDEEDAARQGIRAAERLLIVVSPAALSSRTVKENLRIANLYQRRPVFVWAAGEEHAGTLLQEWGGMAKIDMVDARGDRYAQALEELIASLMEEAPQEDFTQPEPPPDPRNPYKGLRAFTADDAPDFFGRDALIGELIEKLKSLLSAEQPDMPPSRLLTVIGPSGSGKSSVVMAGLLPRLQRGVLPGSAQWVYLPWVVPGTHPMEALTIALASCLTDRSVRSIREDLEDASARGLLRLSSQLLKTPEQRVVLLIDQCEELFRLTAYEDERQQFIELLVATAREPQGKVVILLTLRADFYNQVLAYPELARLITANQVVVLPMDVQDLRDVMRRPAALPDVQLRFEGNLVGDLLFEVQGQVGALPLLEFTLEQLFERRSEHRLTVVAYREIGGVKGALSQHAERTYAALPSEGHRKRSRALFVRLIDPGLSEQDTTRRRAALAEFALADPAATRLLQETVDAFIAARLLTTNEVAGTTTIEVSHEALIREWQRLVEWLREAREDLRLLQVIREDAAEWLRHAQSVDRLYRGAQLAEALAWRDRTLLSRDEEAFLQASLSEQERREALEAERQRQERLLRRRYARRTVLVGLGLAATAATVSGILFARSATPPSRPLPVLALPYAYTGHGDVVNSVAWSPDGKRIASASVDRTVRVWDEATGATLLTYAKHGDAVNGVAWSPDGKYIVSASSDNTARVWDAATGSTLLTYTGHSDVVNSVAWSPDGKYIVSASDDSTAQVWDALKGGLITSYNAHTASVTAVAWSPNSQRIASASYDHTARVWAAATGAFIASYTGHSDVVNSVAWSPDSERIASTSVDRTAQVWDASNGQRIFTCAGHSDTVTSAAWSRDGQRLASASFDETVQVWSAANGSPLFIYGGHSDIVTDVAWAPDSKRIASASDDKTVQVWNASPFTRNTTGYTLFTYAGNSVAWSLPDGKRLASTSDVESTVRVLDATNGTLIVSYPGHTGGAYSAAWSPDGSRIASTGYDDTVQVWNSTTATKLYSHPLLIAFQPIAFSAAWSPDGSRVASGGTNAVVLLSDSADRVLSIYRGHTNVVTDVAWSADGSRLASASLDKTVRVWDTSNRVTLRTYIGHSGAVNSVAWSPYGKHIASASFDNTVRVWDSTSGATLVIYKGHSGAVNRVAWSPDGQRLVSVSDDKTVQVWNPTSGATLFTYSQHTDRVIDVGWSPNGKLLASADAADTTRVWLWS